MVRCRIGDGEMIDAGYWKERLDKLDVEAVWDIYADAQEAGDLSVEDVIREELERRGVYC
jgi:hypothetical protein